MTDCPICKEPACYVPHEHCESCGAPCDPSVEGSHAEGGCDQWRKQRALNAEASARLIAKAVAEALSSV